MTYKDKGSYESSPPCTRETQGVGYAGSSGDDSSQEQ